MALNLANGPTIRQDLIAAPTNPKGFVYKDICPVLGIAQWSGNIPTAVATTTTSVAGRDVDGNVDRTQKSSTLTAFDMSSGEQVDGSLIRQHEITHYGSVEAAERVLAIKGVNTISTKLETIVYDAYKGASLSGTATVAAPLDAGKYTNISTDKFNGIHNTVLAMQPWGRVAVIAGVGAYNSIRTDSIVIQRAQFLAGSANEGQLRSISKEQLAMIFEADEVFVSNPSTSVWGVDRVVVMVIPDPSLHPMVAPQAARLVQFNWTLDGTNYDMICEELYDPLAKALAIDVTAFAQVIVPNTRFIQALSITGS